MAQERRFLLILSGRLDQIGLAELRRVLGLRSLGRLTDGEDSQFGYRNIGDGGSPSMVLELWRHGDEQWAVSLDVASDVDVSEDEIARWRMQAEAAAHAVGLTMVEHRSFAPERLPSHRTDWRNENWLRTVQWDLPAQTLQELWPVLGLSEAAPSGEKRAELVRFMATPAWEAAPMLIRREAEAFLR